MTTATWMDALTAVRTRFDTEVTVALLLPTQHDNHDLVPDHSAPWVRLRIDAGRQELLERADEDTYQTPFVATASLYAPLAIGDGALYALADQIATPFKSRTVGPVTCLSPAVGNRRRSGELWQLDITIPFYVEDQG